MKPELRFPIYIHKYNSPWTKEVSELFAFELASKLVCHDFRIISGFGLGIGPSIINGALEEIMRSKYKHVDEYLCLRPFPQGITDEAKSEQLKQAYREDKSSICKI